MAQAITIANIEVKEGDSAKGHWVHYIITGEDNAKVNTFDRSASSLKIGDTIEAEIELKGKYTNLKSFKVLEKSPLRPGSGQATQPPGDGKGKPPSKSTTDERIDNAVAVKAVVELVACGAIPHNHPLFGAVINWCWDRLLPGSVKPQPKAELELIQKALQSSPGPAKKEVEGKPTSQLNLEDIKTEMLDAHWTTTGALAWINSKANYRGLDLSGSFSDVLKRMSPAQLDFFLKELEDRVQKA